MCRNIRSLFNFDPPASEQEIFDAAQQYVRKISGFSKPSQLNQQAFNDAVHDIAAISARLLTGLETKAPKRNREVEASKAKARSAQRFAQAEE